MVHLVLSQALLNIWLYHPALWGVNQYVSKPVLLESSVLAWIQSLRFRLRGITEWSSVKVTKRLKVQQTKPTRSILD